MAKRNEFDEEAFVTENIGVNTPEREDNMDEKKEFFDETKAEELMESTEDDIQDDNEEEQPKNLPATTEDPNKKVGFFGGIKRWFLKKWKWLVAIGAVVIVGGVVYVYIMGKKPIKIGSVDEITDEMKKDSDKQNVIDFAEEAKKLAKEMVANPDNWEVKEV